MAGAWQGYWNSFHRGFCDVVDRMRSMEVQGIDLVVLSISRTPVMYRAEVSADPDLRMAAGPLADQLRGVGLDDESVENIAGRNTMRLFKVCVIDPAGRRLPVQLAGK